MSTLLKLIITSAVLSLTPTGVQASTNGQVNFYQDDNCQTLCGAVCPGGKGGYTLNPAGARKRDLFSRNSPNCGQGIPYPQCNHGSQSAMIIDATDLLEPFYFTSDDGCSQKSTSQTIQTNFCYTASALKLDGLEGIDNGSGAICP